MISEKGKWALKQIIFTDILEELEKEFNKIDIDFMPIKGAYLISSGLAEKIESRKISDIDILVKPEDLKDASRYFSNLPQFKLVTWYADNYRPTETVLKYKFNEIEYTIEIMDRINSEARFLLPSNELFTRSVNIRDKLYYPSPEDSLLIHICHLQSHIPFEFRDTNLLEADLLINQNDFNWNRFWEYAQKTGMLSFVIFFLEFYLKYYNHEIKFKKGYTYSKVLAKWFTVEKYNHLPSIFKRLMLDIIFTRRPLALISQKIFVKNYAKKRN